MGSISCGNCGQTHSSVAEVRACHSGQAPSTPAVVPARPDDAATAAATPSPLTCEPQAVAGPDVLGRRLLIAPDTEIPRPWDAAPRVRLAEPDLLDRLTELHHSRTRAVVIADTDLPSPGPVTLSTFWELDAGTELPDERLAHLIRANTIDARDQDVVRFDAIRRALDAGATFLGGPDGDVRLPDGSIAWCDEGPLAWFDDLENHVVPSVHLERGSLRPLGRQAPRADLANDQLAAVAHSGGGARIIAPAGSGKTRVLTERARHLLMDRAIDPATVCLVAFNVRAREEMQSRTTDLNGLEIRTLNSLALAIVNGTGGFVRSRTLDGSLNVIDEREVRRILDRLLPKSRRQAMTDPAAVWIEAINAARLRLRDPQLVESDFGGDVDGLVDVLPEFRRRLAAGGSIDFSDQILRAVEILVTDPVARTAARRRCRILLVDEFQDLAPAHVLLLRLLAGPQAEIFGVGDDDQTIYGYNGASPEWLIDFSRHVPGAGSHGLEVNYRCPSDVVAAASTLLSHNRRRVDKTICARPGRRDPAAALTIEEAETPQGTLDKLVAWVSDRVTGGASPEDIAILTRVNATLLAPMVALREAGISTTQAVHASFLHRTGVAGAVAWLDLATAPDGLLPGEDLATAARRPPRALHPRFVEWISEKTSPAEIEAMANRLREDRDRDKVLGFVEDLEHIRRSVRDGATTRDLLEVIRDDIGMGGALERRLDASKRSVDRSAHGDDLDAMIAIADLHPEPSTFVGWLRAQLTPTDDADSDAPRVTLSTIHRVKGLEWPHVVVHEANAGLFPHRLSDDVEEERRLFHVGITRCSSDVLVTSTEPSSPFLPQLHEEYDPTTAPTPEERPRRVGRAEPSKPDNDDPRREALRAWRLDRARADGVPPYVIFNDRTMDELLARAPSNTRELLAVPGIGPAKVTNYGDDLLAFFA